MKLGFFNSILSPLLFVLLSPLAILAQEQLPPPLPIVNDLPPLTNNSLPPLTFSSFREAYTAGSTAAKEQRWQDSLTAFNVALPLAQTEQEKIYTQKWIEYVNKQMSSYMTAQTSQISDQVVSNRDSEEITQWQSIQSNWPIYQKLVKEDGGGTDEKAYQLHKTLNIPIAWEVEITSVIPVTVATYFNRLPQISYNYCGNIKGNASCKVKFDQDDQILNIGDNVLVRGSLFGLDENNNEVVLMSANWKRIEPVGVSGITSLTFRDDYIAGIKAVDEEDQQEALADFNAAVSLVKPEQDIVLVDKWVQTVLVGIRSVNNKSWEDAIGDFDAALSIANTLQKKHFTQKLIQFTKIQESIPPTIMANFYEEKIRANLEKITNTLNNSEDVSASGSPRVLLKEGGYTAKSKVQIFKSFLTLTDTSTGDIAIDATFYIYATRGPKPCIEKIKVVLDNERSDVPAVNLWAWVPTFFYFEGNEGTGNGFKNALGFCSLESYALSKNLFQFPTKDYFVGYGKKVARIFHYGEDYAPNGKVGTLNYSDIFDIIMHRKLVPGDIDFGMGFGGNADHTNYKLTHFEKIYPAK